ncbi:MAG: MFS transporter [Liquorilactobacillus nagelii]|jgi:EmrB/QacA subfamily drug resistance transporter|uniref:MFS transporter n=1 Tax=Liquorilactobacillus nagelii TaxID=82688 RepID=A0A3S6QVE0_9LACO|nr:MFS transporter [Liquorilactobacillus nagelii]AUJ32131.1 MFS transporter [Liquorilactobacillus nagelii]MCC7615295.1 MFS transporter [Liquorilactobacillus nagelii]MCP9315456.1 MFS transporter [Liquorilactobacillus nagelii]
MNHQNYKFLPVLLLGNLLCMMDTSIMTIILPQLQSAFNESLSNLSWALNIYTIIFAVLIIPFGRLAERIGRNKFVFGSLIIFGIGSLLSGLAPNLNWMLAARAIQSIGAAGIIPTSMVIGLENSNQVNRNKVVAALAGIQGLAVALGPTTGGIVTQFWGWRWVFLINLPLVLLDLVLFLWVFPLKNESTSKTSIDWLGAGLSMTILFCLSLALIQGNKWGWQSSVIISLLISSELLLIVFLVWEKSQKNPMIDLSLFKSRNFNGAGLALILCNYFLGGMAVLIPTFLTKIQGESELKAALLITPYSLAVMISVIMTSLAVKKINNQLLISCGLLTIALSYYLFAHLNVAANYRQLIIADIVLGTGYGLVAATANILAVADFHGSKLTTSQSVANVLRQIGMVLAIAIFTAILTSNVQSAKQKTATYAVQQTQSLNFSTSQQAKLKFTIRKKLLNNQTQFKQKFKFSKIAINQNKEQRLINQIYYRQLQILSVRDQLAINKLPPKIKNQLKVQVVRNVKMTTIQKEEKFQKKLGKLVRRTKVELKNQLSTAFLNVYAVMFWIALSSLLIIPLFKFNYQPKR